MRRRLFPNSSFYLSALHGNFFLVIILFLLSQCGRPKEPPASLYTLMDSTGIRFTNTVTDSKSDNSFYFRNFYNGGGVALGDINNDGLPDVMMTSNMGENKLFLNKGNFSFEDISRSAGLKQDSMWSTGVTMADVNADGWLDIYVCNSGHMKSGHRRNQLYINNHNNSFTESARQYGLDISGYCTQASFFDYDLDGDLDMFLINNSPIPFSSLDYAGMRDVDISKWKVSEELKGGGNHLYQNNGGQFTEVTAKAGLHSGLISFGLGVSVGDINGDNYPDLYVGNDFIEKDYLYINQKNGTFRDELESRVQKISMSSMSSDLGDINNDGQLDIFTTDMIPDDDYRLKTTGTFDNIDLYLSKQKAGLYHQFVRNCLQLNNGNGQFSELANFCGVSATDWSWGALFLDADNDGKSDLFICNGINKDLGDLDFLDFFSNDVYKQMLETGKRQDIDELLKKIPVTPLPNRVFKNEGALSFRETGGEWGLATPSFSNSIAYADLDNDGDLDLVVNNENMPSFVYRNNARAQNKNNFISVMLKGKSQNTFAVGACIKVYVKDQILSRDVNPTRGFQSSVDYRQVIGLGAGIQPDSMNIIWPGGAVTHFDKPRVNTLLEISQSSQPETSYTLTNKIASPLFAMDSNNFSAHVEDDHIDFYYERNVPELLSHEGPHASVGDVNGDGRADIYIGGSADHGGQLYLQNPSGGYTVSEQKGFQAYAGFEDVAVLFFDCDHDGDLDLFLGAGGNNAHPGARELQHRLFKNDGHGNFQLDAQAFPDNNMNIATAVADDFDGDGDQDLFVGSRSVPFSYGVAPRSYLYKNDGAGHFTDVSSEALASVGMVTAAVWADVDGDQKKELIVVGAFMAPRIFKIGKDGSTSELLKSGLQDLQGWWQAVAAGDLNGDGIVDLVLGNIGENFYLRPTKEAPVKLWVSDFDGNGTVDQFLSRTVGGRDVPVFLKREMTDQFPGLKKGNLRHADYARKSIQELFAAPVLEKAQVHGFNFGASVIAFGDGKGHFSVAPLPTMVQLSSVNAIWIGEVNGDQKPDLVLGGNMFGFPPQFGRLDASYGHVLTGDGKGKFTWLGPNQSGLSVTGEIRDIQSLHTPNNELLLLRNNMKPVRLVFSKKKNS